MRLAACAASALVLCAPCALAQTPSIRTANTTDVIVVTGVVVPATEEKIGSALTVIPAQLIEDGGYSYVADVLRQVPGVSISRTGPLGGLTQARIRGAEANHTLVLLDGVDLSAAGNGETDLSSLLSGDLDRIEVLRGPQSGLYGSNALAGVVNLVSQRNIDGRYIGASLEGGSFGTAELQARGGWGDGDTYVSGGFHARRSEGYDVSIVNQSVGAPLVPGDREDAKLATVYLRGGVQLTPAFRLDGFTRFNRRQAGLDGQAFSGAIAGRSYDDDSRTRTTDVNIAVSGELDLLDGDWVTTGSATYSESDAAGVGFSFPSGSVSLSGSEASRQTAVLRSTYAFGPAGFASFLTGFIDSKLERYRNACPIIAPATPTCAAAQLPRQERDLLGFGLQYRAEIADQLFLAATIRHDENADFQDADTYSASAAWVIPGWSTRLHASIGTGVTNPSFFEQFGFNPGSYVGNPDLEPEESEGWDAGVEQAFWNGRAVIDLTYFSATLDREITTLFAPPAFIGTPVNSTGTSDREGVEASFTLRPTDTIDLVGSYTWLDATEPAGVEVRRPENQAALDATWRFQGDRAQLNLGVTHNGEQVDTDFSTFRRRTMDAYTLVRFGGSYRVDDRIELYARIENVADEDYEEIIGFRGAPQAVYVGVRFRDDVRR